MRARKLKLISKSDLSFSYLHLFIPVLINLPYPEPNLFAFNLTHLNLSELIIVVNWTSTNLSNPQLNLRELIGPKINLHKLNLSELIIAKRSL